MQSRLKGSLKLPVLMFIIATLLLSAVAVAQSGGARQRSDIEPKYKWDLTKIFSSDAAWEEEFTKLDASLSKFEAFKGKLAESPEMLLACLRLRDSISSIRVNP